MDALPAGFNEADVLLLANWSRLALGVFVGLALLVLGITWLDLRDLPRRRGAVLLALRGAALALAVALVAEPAVELRHVTRVPNHVAIVVDVSASQDLDADAQDRRWDRTREALRDLRERIESDDGEHIFDVYALGETLTPSSIDALLQLDAPTGRETRLDLALEQLDEQAATTEFGGVVIVSDGVDTGALGTRWEPGGELDAGTLQRLERIGGPVHTLATAEPGTLQDVSIARVLYDEFAFVRNAVTVVAEIEVHGYESGTLPVTLRRGADVLQTRQLIIDPNQTRQRVAFEFVPEQLGREIYEVAVPLLDGEVVAENNRDYFVLDIIRDEIRVLQVVGRPSWDVRFLRQLLKQNPSVDLISFFILRSNEDVQRAPNREMSLIPFPTDELFNEELGSFDLVIFQNFTWEPYDMRQYLPRVREYVLGGGGFMMIGGEQSYSVGGYAGTEIEDILAVDIGAARDPSVAIDLTSFRPQLTDAGQRHPVTRLEFDPAANRETWASLPPMRGTNIVQGPADGATVLATHPTLLGADGAAMPVVAVADRGEGRTMAMTIDDAWRWAFESVGDGASSQPYARFFSGAMRWLIRDPELNLVRVEIPEDEFAPGDTVAGTVRVFGYDYAPAADVEGTLQIWRRPLEDPTAEDVLVDELPVRTDARGRVPFEITADTAGAWRIEATVELEAGHPLTDAGLFIAVPPRAETRHIEPRPDLLEAIATASGGDHRVLPSRLGGLHFEPARVRRVDRREVVELWTSPWVLGLFILLLGTEWSLRRRWGRL